MIKEILHSYNNSTKLIWVQEEPRNMGAWNFLWHRLDEIKTEKQKLYCVSRPESASPAVGSARITMQQQAQLVKEAFQ